MRHQNPRLCTIGALAQYLFWRWHISSKPAPNFQHQQDWYKLKVLVGEQPTEELAYSTYYSACLSALQKAGISSEDITHIPRSSGSQEAKRLGTKEGQVS
jgi:hypothetical protein